MFRSSASTGPSPLYHIDSFLDHVWLADGSIDWIDTAFPEELGGIFTENKEEDDVNYDVNEEEDDDNI